MSLFLYEIVPADAGRDGIEALLREIGGAASSAGGEVIESQVTGSHDQVFVVVEAADAASLGTVLTAERLAGAAEVAGPDQVRLIGAELAEIKAARPKAGYLVEWDFPADLDMDTYLSRKKANAPKYAEVPEVSFLRTYVREDMVKCLCLYDAPDEGIVRKAREVVNTPIDRLHALERGER
ncbi:DUF4242 domain-containing protein [Saccharopolyspora indica]|uniref:DUF4242 domain-containing protein n=1 Tax=Saccharopolyspora indica TaxID=1229659 RepID=UPI0022EAA17C|nr:DUF4242 domain-containing protein [Saccharopolyspora indica]MDA3643917.1 DUF4242 domain-containing protein [Saccharopolyspora indica]